MEKKLAATKRQNYTVSEKLRIVNFAEQNGNRAAERELGVFESNVRLWRKSKENLEKVPHLKLANRGKTAAWPERDVDLLSWITEKRNNGLAILPSLVRLKAVGRQPLDVSLNKPFKDNVWKRWMQWMAAGILELNAGGRQKKPSEELVCSWISEAWHEIPREMIVASFVKCGITNNLDGSDDDLVYEPSKDSAAELDDSAISELFESDSELEFECIVVIIHIEL